MGIITREIFGIIFAGADTESTLLLNLPVVIKLRELDNSICNCIHPLSIFQCEVYQTFPDNSTIAWYVNINGTESKRLVFLKRELDGNVTGYSLKEEIVSKFKLTASTILVHDKTHCTEPIVISTLTVHPPTFINNVNIDPFEFNVTCDIQHTSIPPKCNIATTHCNLTGIN